MQGNERSSDENDAEEPTGLLISEELLDLPFEGKEDKRHIQTPDDHKEHQYCLKVGTIDHLKGLIVYREASS